MKLVIQNSYSELANIPKEHLNDIKELLSYTDKSQEYSYYKTLRDVQRFRQIVESGRASEGVEKRLRGLERNLRFLKKKMKVCLLEKTKFPTGLVGLVKWFCADRDIDIEVEDARKQPDLLKFKYLTRENFPPLRYYQKEAIAKAMEHHRGVMEMCTGSGKTLTITKLIWELGLKTLIITPSKPINTMMTDTMKKYFGKGKVTSINTKSRNFKHIGVCNIQALKKVPKSLMNDVDVVIIDEFHHSASQTYQDVNKELLGDVYFRFGFTGTNFRNDGSDLALQGILSNVLYEYHAVQAVKDGFLVQPEFKVINNKTPHENTYQKEYKKCLVENDTRNKLIAGLARKHENESVLILVQQISHGERLLEVLPEATFVNGEKPSRDTEKALDKFRHGEINLLIGTSVIGEGVDVPRAKVLIMAGGGKAESQIIQNIGRVLRQHPTKDQALIYDFTDEGSKYLSKHSEERRKVFSLYDF